MFQSLISELASKGTVQFYVRARPGMPSTKAVDVMGDESIKIDVAAPAEGGKANVELIKYIAKEFGVSRDQVLVVSGKAVRVKLVRIQLIG